MSVRLSENPDWTVLLLEAGGEEPDIADVPALAPYNFGSRLDWKYVAEKQQTSCGGNPCTYPRGKVLGGSSVLNMMGYLRGFPRDYQQWADTGNIPCIFLKFLEKGIKFTKFTVLLHIRNIIFIIFIQVQS